MSNLNCSLGNFEEQILLAVSQLSEIDKASCYGVKIRQLLVEVTGRDISPGALYTTLERLEKKGLLSSYVGEATPERGGRAKRYFCIEAAGEDALKVAETARQRLKQAGQGGFQPA